MKCKKELKETYKEIFDVVAGIILKWDPYGLISDGSPIDEFDVEITKVITQFNKISSPESAAKIISDIFCKSFEKNRFDPEICLPIGRILFEELIKSGYIKSSE